MIIQTKNIVNYISGRFFQIFFIHNAITIDFFVNNLMIVFTQIIETFISKSRFLCELFLISSINAKRFAQKPFNNAANSKFSVQTIFKTTKQKKSERT